MPFFKKKKEGVKKKFKDTKIGIFLKEKAPDLLDKVGDFLPDKGVLGIVKNIIDKDDKLSPEDKAKATELLAHELSMYEIDHKDRASAREREMTYVNADKRDWMMISTGIVGLGCFILMVVAVIFYPKNITENALYHQLMGNIEGVAMTIFAYYYGSSKGSSDKTKMMNGGKNE